MAAERREAPVTLQHDSKGLGRPAESHTACELGFRGSLDEWERLMGQLRGGERAVLAPGKDV